MGDSVETVKQNLRSVLVSSKAGVKANRLQGDYQELCGGYIPHTKFGFSTLHEFIVSIKDVVRVGRNNDNEITYFAVADSSTKHIQALVSKQKSKKLPKKKAPTSSSRNRFSTRTPKPYNTQTLSKPPPKKMYAVKPKKKLSSVSAPSRNSDKENFKINTVKNARNSYQDSRSNNSSAPIPKKPVTVNTKKPLSANAKNVGAASARNKNLAPKFQKNNDYYAKNRNNVDVPPRFLKKSVGKNVSEGALYENPLQSPQNKNNVIKNSSGQPNRSNDIDTSNASAKISSSNNELDPVNMDILHNLTKLLSIYAYGVHLSGVFNLYKETFDQDLPMSLVNKIVRGEIQGYASVDKVNITGENKYILFPYVERQVLSEKAPVAVDVDPHGFLTFGEEYEVVVTYSPTCHKVYIQLVSENARLKEMSLLIQKSFKSSSVSHLLKTGSYVITNDYFRAKILSINKQQIEIYKIDFEDCTASYWTTLEDVRPMSQEIASFPEFCVCCNMHRPAKEAAENWSSSSAEEFLKVYANTELLVKTIAINSAKSTSFSPCEHTVIFYKVNEKYKCNINARLIEEEDAIFSDLAKHTDPFEHQPLNFASLPEEDNCQLFVFNAFCTTETEVCVIGVGYSDELASLENEMFDFYSSLKKDFNLPAAPPCDCVYAVLSDDNCTRGRLISLEGNGQGTVYLVDNGETEIISLQSLRPLTKGFAHLPMQSINVSLAGLDYESLSTHSSILQKLSDVVVHKTCPARIIARRSNSSNVVHDVVELFHPGNASVCVNQLCLDVIMDDTLMPTLPSEGDFSAVSVGNVDAENSLVFVRLVGEGMVKLKACLSNLELSIDFDKIVPSQQAVDIYPDKNCLVFFQNGLCRARVQKCLKNLVAVYLMDLGVYKEIPTKSLIKLDDEETLSIPPQAVCCKLSEEVPEENNLRSLKDVSGYITAVPVSMRVDSLSANTDPDLVSLWMNDKNKVRVVANNGVIARAKIANKNRLISSPRIFGFDSGEPTSTEDKSSSLHSYRTSSDVDDLSSLSSTSNSVKCSSPFHNESGDALLASNSSTISSGPKNEQYMMSDLRNYAYFMYGKTSMKQYEEVLSLDENPFLIQVEDVISPDYLQIIALKNLPGRKFLTSALSKFYEQKQSDFLVKNFARGDMYAMYANTEKCWCRVRLLNTMDNEFSVYLVDFGKFLISASSLLRTLDKRFTTVPDLVYTARLSGIKPLGGTDNTWSNEISQKLCEMIRRKDFYAHVLKIVRNDGLHRDVWEICLCDTTSGQDVWINDLLVDDWKCAVYVD